MSELNSSSQIQNCLFGLSDSENDSGPDINTDLESTPERESIIHDFSSGSGEEYNPDSDNDCESDSEHGSRLRPIRRLDQPSTSGTNQRHLPLTNRPNTISDSDTDSDDGNLPVAPNLSH
uniref:Uncharacterized protein n=1 Tax=Clastoptera arizonana TaxID=38151 RepID=A0A1B6CHD4_9HEMI